MTDLNLDDLLYQALKRVVPYFDLLPPGAAFQVRHAINVYEIRAARRAIVQTPQVAQQLAAGRRDPDQVGERHE